MQKGSVIVEISGIGIQLLTSRSLFIPDFHLVVVSDVHLGKAGHFRKHGIPISSAIHGEDINRLQDLIDQLQPKSMLFLGDLFHSVENSEWEQFTKFLLRNHTIQFILVKGNHDILTDKAYDHLNLEVTPRFLLASLSFTHEKETDLYFNMSGHIHPGVRIRGAAKQQLTLPCFYLGLDHLIMPAFGLFTGSKSMKIKKGDRVFAITNTEVIELNNQ
jgi:DNA ligase-associated metallophosphoesterase